MNVPGFLQPSVDLEHYKGSYVSLMTQPESEGPIAIGFSLQTLRRQLGQPGMMPTGFRAPQASEHTTATLIELLDLRAASQPRETAYTLIDGEGQAGPSITYDELLGNVTAIAARLRQMKLAGERAILLYPAGVDYIAAFFGCLYAGVVAVPAFPPRANRNNERLIAIIDDAKPAIALTTSGLRKKAEAALSTDRVQKNVISVISTDDITSMLERTPDRFAPSPDDLAYLQYTSGSTAAPKGVMLSHRNVLSNLVYIDEGFEHGRDSVSLTWLPHFHDMGLVDGILMPLFRGFHGLLMTPTAFLRSPILWLRAITQYRVTHTGGPNFAYDLCVRKTTTEQRSQLDLRSWAVAYNGAEPINAAALDRFAETFGPYGFRSSALYPAYGLAEATLKVSGGRRSDPPVYCRVDSSALERNKVVVTGSNAGEARRLVGCGGFGAATSVAIVNPDTRTGCQPDDIGEIWVSGPGVANGFWNRADESEQVFRAFTSDSRKGPYLRTGDLGFVRDGELYVTGRLKDLIIIRGRNHYPQDIEAAASRSHPALRSGGGAAFSTDDAGAERLIVVHELENRKCDNADEIVSAIRQAVSAAHEVQVAGVVLLRPGSLPRTSSGKTQRRACRTLFLNRQLEAVAEWSASASQIDDLATTDDDLYEDDALSPESVLRRIVARKLRTADDQISSSEPLSRYGIDSLTAIELAHEIETRFSSRISMASLLSDLSLEQLAEEIASASNSTSGDLASVGSTSRDSKHPLSRGQQAIWFLYQMDPLSVAYNMAGAVRIGSDLNVEALHHAFQLLVERHDSLRGTFRSDGGVAYQYVESGAEVSFKVRDALTWTDDDLKHEVEQEAHRPFDLENGPVFRVTLYQRASGQHVLLIVVHHIVADFWSLAVMMDELGKLYRAEGPAAQIMGDPRASYADFVDRQDSMLSSAAGEDHWRYWSRQLAGELPTLALPTDRERPRVQTYRGGSIAFDIEAEQVQAAKSLSSECQTTLFVTLLTAFEVFLSRYCGQDELLIGTPTSGRTSSDFTAVIGYFVNPVVVRSRIRAGENFQDRLHQEKKTVVEAFYHQEYPFPDIVKRLNAGRDQSRSPLFQVMFALQRSHLDPSGQLAAISLGDPDASLQLGPLKVSGFPLEQRVAQFDITLTVAETRNAVKGAFEYNADLFDRASIERMSPRFLALFNALVSSPTDPVSRASYITEVERRQLLDEWGDNSREPYQFVPVHNVFERQAAAIPDSVALIYRDSALTYGELDATANKLCAYLRTARVNQETPVVLLLHRSMEMIVAPIAVMKSGGAYVPIDPSAPSSRVRAIVDDLRPPVILTHSDLAAKADGCGVDTFCFDCDWGRLEDVPGLDRGIDVDGEATCYVIYTSGSTGVPKGVAVRNFSFARYLDGVQTYYQTNHDDRILQFASLSFDGSMDEIFVPLTSGACLVIHSDSGTTSSTGLIEECREQMITHLSLPTAYWHAIVSDLSSEDWASAGSVRFAVIGGEAALSEKLNDWLETAGNRIALFNSYGPTETTIAVTFWNAAECSGDGPSRVPIGPPTPGTYIYVVDTHGHPSPGGVAGEICIGGDGVARGYVHDPAKTADRFIPDIFGKRIGGRVYRSGDLGRFIAGGNLECLGRADRQVKVRGFRIELEEVEAALSRIPFIKEAVTIVANDTKGNKRLIAYAVLEKEADRDPRILRSALKDDIPAFMIPSHFVFLDELPTNAAGKIDRRALPPIRAELEEGSISEGKSGSNLEQRLAQIWSKVLGIAVLGFNDNFFEIGGDSILSLQVVARAREDGIVVTPRQLFEYPTVSSLAAAVSVESSARDQEYSIAGRASLTPVQRWFFDCDFEDAHHWNMALMLDVNETLEMNVISLAFSRLAAQHEVLSSTFVCVDGHWRRSFGTGIAPMVTEVSLTGLSQADGMALLKSTIAFEQAGLDLVRGPLLRSVLFRTAVNEPDELLLVVHHLIADAVSLRIIVEDLERSSREFIHGDDWYLNIASRRECASENPEGFDSFTAEPGGAKSAPIAAWATQLEHLAASPGILAELDYWSRLETASVSRLPVDRDGDNLEKTATAIKKRFDCGQTSELIRIARERYHSRVDEMLVAALAATLSDWMKRETVLIELERHGREAPSIEMDVSRSIGWFTSTFPALIRIDSSSGPAEAFRSVKESLRAIPNAGIGFGLLRYLSEDDGIRVRMRSLPQPEVSFNYLGNLDRSFTSFTGRRVFDHPEILTSGTRSPKSVRTHLLEIDSAIMAGELEVQFRFSSDVFKTETIELVADWFAGHLASIVESGKAGEPVCYSPSDFPLVQLNQAQLNRLVSSSKPIDDIYPLSPSQQGMLFHAIYSKEGDVYSGTLTLLITGRLDEVAFEEAWRRIVSRHSIFRTSFAWEDLAEPIQIVHPDAVLSVDQLDWSSESEALALERLSEFAREEQARGFDLGIAPLMRLTLVGMSDQRHYLILALHHLLIDGWSISLLFSELFEIYEQRLKQTDLRENKAGSFGTYISWLRKQDRRAAENFWRKYLSGFFTPTALGLQEGSSDPDRSSEYTRQRTTLSAYLSSRLSAFARQNRVTVNTLVQGAWAILLSRYSGDQDVVFGAVTAGRPAALPRNQEIIGPFTVTLPVRIKLPADRALGSWLRALQENHVEARQFDYCSLVDIQGWSDVARGRQLFESILAFENYPLDVERLGVSAGLSVDLIESRDSTNYRLTVVVFPGDHLTFDVIYHVDSFQRAAIERLRRHFETLLSEFPEGASAPIGCVPILSPAEKEQILHIWSGEVTEFPREKTVAALFREQAELSPDAVSAVFAARQVTYSEVLRRAAAIANHLAGCGVNLESVVGISTERSIEMIVGLLGILQAGAAYLPVDTSYPAERIRFILGDSRATLLLTPSGAEGVPDVNGVEKLSVENILAQSESASCEGPGSSEGPWECAIAESLAYVIYTSGSTGTPKGVAVTNRAVVRLVKQTNYFDFGPDEVFLQSSTLSFDASTFEIWGALLNGAKLVLMPPGTPALDEIASALRTHQITTAWFTSGLFHLLVQDKQDDVSSVRTILAGGDVVAIEDALKLAACGSGNSLINGYGPTEGTTFTACYRFDRLSFVAPSLPIGRPISNTRVFIVDQHLNLVLQEIPGELYIGGDGLARGYVGAADLTAEKFLPNPFSGIAGDRLYRSGDLARFRADGNIEFLGRRDSQVKIRGFRIEPREIESALAAHPAVKQCAIVSKGDTAGDKTLVAYLSARSGEGVSVAEVREFLRERVPDYMVPSSFVILDSLPLTTNGKVDRRALPSPEIERYVSEAAYVPPRNAIEEVLAGIWEEHLGRDGIGVRDDFFALGGHSLTAMRVISAIRYVFKVDVTVSKVFESPTIERLAQELTAVEAKPGQTEKIARVAQRIKNMSAEEKAEKLRTRAQRSV